MSAHERLTRLANLLDTLGETLGQGYLSLIRCFPGYVAIYDADSAGVVFSSDFCELMKLQEQDMVGQAWQHLVHPEDFGNTARVARDSKKPERSYITNRWKDGDGNYRTLVWVVSPWEHVGDGVEYSICVVKEVLDE